MDGKVALVTRAAQGIGYAMSEALLKKGAKNGVIHGCQLAIEYMSKATGGHGGIVVNSSSIAGLRPFPLIPVYTATKYAVLGYTRSLALQAALKENGLKFVALCPHLVQTPLGKDIYAGIDSLPQERRDAVKHIMETTVGWLSPEEIANESMALLASDTPSGAVPEVSKVGGAVFK